MAGRSEAIATPDMGNGWVGCDDGIGHAVERVFGKGGSVALLSALRQEKSAEHLLNNRPQMRASECNQEGWNANKTNENWSVRTGQGELANRRIQPLCHLSADGSTEANRPNHSSISLKCGRKRGQF